MSCMFRHCENLPSLNLSKFNTRKVTNMRSMFESCDSLKSLNLNNFNTSKVTNMNCMFYCCNSLKSLNLNNFNTSKVTNMYGMFQNCYNLTNLNISKFKTDKVTDMRYMFADCQKIKKRITNLKIPTKADTTGMYFNCFKIKQILVHKFKDNNITFKIYSNGLLEVTGTGNYGSDYPLNDYKEYISKAKINVQNITNLSHLFYDCTKLSIVDLSELDTSSVINMSYMFDGCESLESLDLNKPDTSNVKDMSHMFDGCKSLKTVDLSSLDTSNVSNMSFMFVNCKKLSNIGVDELPHHTDTKTFGMFAGCYQYRPDDYYEAKTAGITWRYYNNGLLEVTGSGELVYGGYDEYYADVEPIWNGYQPFIKYAKLEVSGITNLTMLFKDCTQLEQVDLSKLDTSNVTSVDYMFSNCSKLKTGKETLKLPDTVDTTLLNRKYIHEMEEGD